VAGGDAFARRRKTRLEVAQSASSEMLPKKEHNGGLNNIYNPDYKNCPQPYPVLDSRIILGEDRRHPSSLTH
jgi:hypothetical protein